MKSELRMLCMTFLLKKAVYLLGPKTEMSVPRSIVCFVVHLSKSEKKNCRTNMKRKTVNDSSVFRNN